MIRLPHDRRTRIQFASIAVFLLTFYFGVRYVANWIEGGHDFLELREAIERGNMEEIKRQLDASASPNVRSPSDGETALVVAIEKGNREVIKLLLDRGANPNLADDYGRTALHTAASSSAVFTQLLLDSGAETDVADDQNETPLHSAAWSGNLDAVRLLIEHGAPLHTRANQEWSLQAGTPAEVALRYGNTEIAKYILFEAGKSDFTGENLDTLLDAAAAAGDAQLVRTFAEAGADPDVPDVRQIWHEYGQVYVGALTSAVMSGSAEVVETLIDLGVTIQDAQQFNGVPLLAVAAVEDAAAIIDLLLQNGLDVNYADNRGRTALHSAAQNSAVSAVRVLIDAGADVNARSEYGETPVYFAVESTSADVLQLLLESNADLSVPNANGGTPLALAQQIVMRADQPDTPLATRVNAKVVLDLLERHLSQSDGSSITSP